MGGCVAEWWALDAAECQLGPRVVGDMRAARPPMDNMDYNIPDWDLISGEFAGASGLALGYGTTTSRAF